MTPKFAINDVAAQVRVSFTGVGEMMAHAATSAMYEAGDQLKLRGRANIGQAGFSSRWQNAWRVNVYPVRGVSLEPAAFGFHKIGYSGVFESGATITGKRGLLWLPIGNNLPKAGRRKISTPRDLVGRGVKLFSIKGQGRPLLGASVRVPTALPGNKSTRRDQAFKLSLAKLKKGSGGKRGVVQTVPLFSGVRSVTLKKRFNIAGVAQQVSGQLGALYFANLEQR